MVEIDIHYREFNFNPTLLDIQYAEINKHMELAGLLSIYFEKNKNNLPCELNELYKIYEKKGIKGLETELYFFHEKDNLYLGHIFDKM
ncbi:MAG: hypothetical protein PHN56_04625 [Candidatus Nanoarchaeia archaeon]|nr:hypothetical protein [Candidatus Nanoarchaeia archaeon]